MNRKWPWFSNLVFISVFFLITHKNVLVVPGRGERRRSHATVRTSVRSERMPSAIAAVAAPVSDRTGEKSSVFQLCYSEIRNYVLCMKYIASLSILLFSNANISIADMVRIKHLILGLGTNAPNWFIL